MADAGAFRVEGAVVVNYEIEIMKNMLKKKYRRMRRSGRNKPSSFFMPLKIRENYKPFYERRSDSCFFCFYLLRKESYLWLGAQG